MKTNYISHYLALLAAAHLMSCTEPIPIEVEQSPTQLAISTTVIDSTICLATVTYSLNSLININEGKLVDQPIDYLSKLLATNAIVTLESATGKDTLYPILPGIYGSYRLRLKPGQTYHLQVYDPETKLRITASTPYLSEPGIDTLYPQVVRHQMDSTVHLHLVLKDKGSEMKYYFLHYNHIGPLKRPSPLGSDQLRLLLANPNKPIELFTSADGKDGFIKKDFSLDLSRKDSLYVLVSQIDKGYYDYLSAYKRSGSLLTQFINEPVTLPSNIDKGLGYFSLSQWKPYFFRIK